MDTIKQHDTYPYLSFRFLDADGAAIDCTGYSVRLLVKDKAGTVVIDAILDAPDSGAVWLNKAGGTGEYHWKPADTQNTGRYDYEFEFTRELDGKIFTLPQDSYYTYSVYKDIE